MTTDTSTALLVKFWIGHHIEYLPMPACSERRDVVEKARMLGAWAWEVVSE